MWKCLAVLASLILLTACVVSSGALLEPVSGPLFEARAPSLQVNFSRTGSGAGQVRIHMPDGEIINGEYRTMGRSYTGLGSGPGAAQSDPLAVTREDWKALYGSPDVTAGQISGQITGTGDMGTLFRAEYIMDPVDSRGYGVAKDSKGNLFRLKIHVLVY